MLHRSIVVKRNSAEALAFLMRDENTRNTLNDDRVFHVCYSEY